MPSVLPAWIPDLDDLKKSVARCPHCGSRGLLHLAHVSTSIDARIKRCWKLSTQACTQAERDAWRAEEEGLRDALLERDQTHQYRERPAAVFERYAMGVEDGKALIRLACMDAQQTPSVQYDTGVIRDSSRSTIGTGRASLVSRCRALWEKMYALLSSTEANTTGPLTIQPGLSSGEMTCPQCSSSVCLRVQRHGWRDFLWRLTRCFPWHCRQCGNRFYSTRRVS